MNKYRLKDIEAFLFDLDGCIYFGNKPAVGSNQLLELIRQDRKKVFFVTNNSTHSSQQIADRLNNMGLNAETHEVIAATEVVGQHMKETYGNLKVKVVGTKNLQLSLSTMGHQVIPLEAAELADMIVVGRDEEFNYAKLLRIVEEVDRGSRIIGTNSDAYHLGSRNERIPETGALTAAIEKMLGFEMEHIGKPEPYMFQYAVERHGLSQATTVMVGDNFSTDILGGCRAGLSTIWVSSDVHLLEQYKIKWGIEPDLIVDDIQALLELYKRC